ncbi:GntR family transcriptional regulator [Saxibacter everestensis]|uniref:GntR family transcriptional regulator n=1 Tax=Saxibacter everestensis TaxID=2909229 RepID=A0ABY8QRK7_9MICO|nr:GntR family transcriptional regulator [Brevibacteriaceae bacterium ZFBP1038]
MTPRTGPAPGARAAVFAQLADVGRAEQVAQRLSDAIVLGLFAPGERLPNETELARRFGVALITAREGLSVLRDAGLVETRRGRDGGSFVTTTQTPDDTVLHDRLLHVSQVELSDLTAYFATIVAGSVELAAERSTVQDTERLKDWLRSADFGTGANGHRNAGGFYLELAVLSQSARLVRENIRLQAEFGTLLWLCMGDAGMRKQTASSNVRIVDAIADHDPEEARSQVRRQIQSMTEWLLDAKAQTEREALDDA